MMVKDADEIDMNPAPECQGTMNCRSTTALFSQPDALKLAVLVSFFEILY